MCTNGLFAATAESGNFVIWDIEERKITFITPLKTVVQLLIHTAETMVGHMSHSSTPLLRRLGSRRHIRTHIPKCRARRRE